MYLLVKGKDLKAEKALNENGEVIVEIFIADNVELQANESVKIEQKIVDNLLVIQAEKQEMKGEQQWAKW